MRRPARRLGALVALVACVACGASNEASVTSQQALPAGAVARVGDRQIAAATVALIAERQGVPPREALARAVADATLALASESSAPAGVVQAIQRAAAARALLERLASEAASAGPATEAELLQLVEERWAELDRPDGVRVVHAVVLNRDPAKMEAARGVAEELLAAVKPAKTSDEFTELARAVPKQGFDVRVEPLPPVTADGRTFEQQEQAFLGLPSRFDLDFARSANALRDFGELSGVVKSAFGLHVIRLQARIPGHRLPPADLPELLGGEAQTRRAARLRRELLDELRAPAGVQLERSVDELTARIRTSP